jgi:hypothetical protein
MIGRGLIAWWLLVAGVAHAQGADDALKLMDQGIALFQAGDLKAAREAFVKARALVPDKANPYRWLGLVDARLGDCGAAVGELETFLSKVPPNDSRTVEAITLRDRCKEELAPKLGTLSVESSPGGAEVRIDDERTAPVGTTPWRSDKIAAGPHLVFLSKDGFQTVSKSVKVTRGSEVRLDLTLQPNPVAVAPQVVAAPALTAQAPAPLPAKRRSRAWIAGPVVGGVVLLAGAVVLGVALTRNAEGNNGNGNNNNILPEVRAP